MPRLSALIVLFALYAGVVAAQPTTYNINKRSGILSNHIYTTIVDNHGYLWIGTTDGIYRYNGYTFKKFDYEDGLSNTDIWHIYKDKKGRIWPITIADDMGYFSNGKYVPVTRDSSAGIPLLYPTHITEKGDSLLFFNKVITNGRGTLIVIVGDTLHAKQGTSPFGANLGNIVAETNIDTIRTYSLENWLADDHPNGIVFSPGFAASQARATQRDVFSRKYLYSASLGAKQILFYNVLNGQCDTVKVSLNDSSYLHHCFSAGDTFYAITTSHLLTFDTTLNTQLAIDIKQLIPRVFRNVPFKYTHATQNPFWGICLATDKTGLFINYPGNSQFREKLIDLEGYTFSGYLNDSTGLWWNSDLHKLAHVVNGNIIAKDAIEISNHHKVISHSPGKALMMNYLNAYWIQPPKMPSDVATGYESVTSIPTAQTNTRQVWWYLRDGVFADSNTIFVINSGEKSIQKIDLHPQTRTVILTRVYYGRFKGIIYNPKLHLVLSYSDNSIILINTINNQQILIDTHLLSLYNIKGIEAVFMDDFGNIIIKNFSKIIIVNLRTGKLKQVYKNLKLEKSLVLVRNNVLYVAGNFGVITSDITGPCTITNTNFYPNTKNIFYSYVTDAQFNNSSAFLKTDNGYYTVNLAHGHNAGQGNKYRVVANYADTLHNLSSGDSITLSPGINTFSIDVINPTGTGQLNIEYSINSGNYNNTGYQVILPALKPGSYNTVSLVASDDSWRSKPLKFTIYIQPKWWQTSTARRIIFVLSLLAFIGFIYLVIVMTRRIVNRNNERRNQRRELELKSIYSQINPHFIFNSLSTAQYFVRKNKNKEAFEHINQFSDLLRAYIKSSRAKYITIAEEIDNLENYLQLQLTRFEEKFDYNITIDTSVNPEKVKIPSLLLQPLVENALNHGIFHSETKGNLHISFKVDEQDKDTLVCIVDDNGIGRQRSKELRGKIIRKADSYGTILIKELIDTFNKYEKINIEIEYVDKLPPLSGTTVTVRIKNYAQIP